MTLSLNDNTDGIGLAALIDAANPVGVTLQIADTPGKIRVVTPTPSPVTFAGIRCSTAHITNEDNALLYHASHGRDAYGDGEWLHYTGIGYMLRVDAWQYPVLQLKRLGLSKAFRRLVVTLMQRHPLAVLHVDAAGEVLQGFAIFDW